MNAIITRWVPLALVRGARYSASNGDFKIYLSERDDLSADDNHRNVLREFCKRRGWSGRLVMGYVKGSERVWVWTAEQRLTAEEILIAPEGYVFEWSALNPDCADEMTLRLWLAFLQLDPKAPEKLWPDGGDKFMAANLEIYIQSKLRAMEFRLIGKIDMAMRFESICDRIYDEIESGARRYAW